MSANLPYPNIDFVPLDVLTAAELNQMVQNDQYLANFWASADSNDVINSNHIADNAIKSNHLSSGTVQIKHFQAKTVISRITKDDSHNISEWASPKMIRTHSFSGLISGVKYLVYLSADYYDSKGKTMEMTINGSNVSERFAPYAPIAGLAGFTLLAGILTPTSGSASVQIGVRGDAVSGLRLGNTSIVLVPYL